MSKTNNDSIQPPAPSRATASFSIMLSSLVPVPIRLFTPTEDVRFVERHMYHRVIDKDGTVTLNPIKLPTTDAVTGEEIPRSETVKAVSVGDQLVELSDDEITRVTAGQAVDKGFVPIETFIPLDSLYRRYKVLAWYQARPQQREVGKKKQDDPAANKAFALLLNVMEQKGVAALVRVGLRSHARYGALTPDGHFLHLHFDEEVRQEREMPDVDLDEKELALAGALVDQIGVSTPTIQNEAAAAVVEYVSQKAAGGATTIEDLSPAPAVDNVLDLTSLLEASVEMAQQQAS
jgi:non-homologous end joining protein Ku